MTAQELFNRTLEHLLKQGGPAVNVKCLYFDRVSGRRCAIGCHIPTELYDPSLEGFSLWQLLNRANPNNDPTLNFLHSEFGPHIELASDLQEVHDYMDGDLNGDPSVRATFELRMRGVAQDFNLEYPTDASC